MKAFKIIYSNKKFDGNILVLIFGTYLFKSSVPPIFPSNQNYLRANEFCHWSKYLIRPKLSTSGKSCPDININKLPYKRVYCRIKAILYYNCNWMFLFSFMLLHLKYFVQLIVVKYSWFFLMYCVLRMHLLNIKMTYS